MLVGAVLGTRPEIIKFSSILRALSARRVPYFVVHTNQHYDRELDAIFFEQLQLSPPDCNLGLGARADTRRTGLMLQAVEQALLDRKPDLVVVQGDTNSTLAGALAASKLNIPVAHVEAGLRSFDRSMPEEINRVTTDHLSTWLFAPTETSAANLNAEGLTAGVHVVGNTVVDALQWHADSLASPPAHSSLQDGDYLLATIHRQNNTESRERLVELVDTLDAISDATGLEILFPAHPRTVNRLAEFGLTDALNSLPRTTVLPAMGHLEFLHVLKHAQVVLTDSGGVQEEACVLGVPAVTFAATTDRPETVDIGANLLAPTGQAAVTNVSKILDAKPAKWAHPFGDGSTGEKILSVLVPTG